MSNKLIIPNFYKEKLKDNLTLNGIVQLAFGEFEIWLEQNKMKFFDGYTDHSINHINEVMDTSVKIIRKACYAYITDNDAAVFLISCLIHDCAMHLSKEGFCDLVNGNYKNNRIYGFKDKSWEELWKEFLIESRRFSSRKLITIFGDPEYVNPPDLKKKNFNDKEYLLIGEFLRRHHHRLAHEIAIYGVPGPNEKKLKILDNEDFEYVLDLAGLVARSHGMDMRLCFNYIKENYQSVKEHRKVHSVFLMALLRISDALQIKPGRAPKELDKIRTLGSPKSKLEWETHQCIKDIIYNDKPETIIVDAKPETNKIYLKVKELIKQIQNELDISWISIGETYGFDESLKEFGLNFRRIISNLDDVQKFSETVEYIPCKASFEAADTDLLKLLVAPLYGDIPGVGVRELLQNSVDAVREMKELIKNNKKLKNIELLDLEGAVVISFDKDENDDFYWFKIEDKGIGMSLDTITQYFLRSGVSFRNSELWRTNFEDKKGNSKVLRSGRFGIGVLAAYLLGDTITVSSRYFNNSFGIEFSTKLEEESIEFKKVNRNIGTTIKIKVDKKVAEDLLNSENDGDYLSKWDWYCLNDIKVTRKVNGKTRKQNQSLPEINSKLPKGWYRIKNKLFADIVWNYNLESSKLVCNGIKIIHEETLYNIHEFKIDNFSFEAPNISVFDYDSNLPLNLQRTSIVTQIPFYIELKKDILLDYFAYLLLYVPTRFNIKWFREVDYKGLYGNISHWIFIKSGCFLAKNELIKKNELESLTNIFLYLYNEYMPSYFNLNNSNIRFIDYEASLLSSDNQYLDEDDLIILMRNLYLEILESKCYKSHRILINKYLYEKIPKTANDKFYQESLKVFQKLKDIISEESKNRYWYCFTIGNPPEDEMVLKFMNTNKYGKKESRNWPGIIFKSYNLNKNYKEKSEIFYAWAKYLIHPFVPFNKKKRSEVFSDAYKKLDKYIKNNEGFFK